MSILNHEHTQEGASIKAYDGPIYFDGTTWGCMHTELIAGQRTYISFPVLPHYSPLKCRVNSARADA